MCTRKLVLSLVLSLIALSSPGAALADGPPLAMELAGGDFVLIPHLQYRPRFVVHTGKNFMDGDTYTAFYQRARLGLEVKAYKWIKARIQLQDVRTWGEETNTLGDVSADGFDLHQGYAELVTPIGLSFRVGRQEINFDNQRLIGAVGWSNQGRSFDAIHAIFDKGPFDGNLFFALAGEKDAYVKDAAGKTVKGSPEDVYVSGFRFRWRGLDAFRPTLVTILDHQGPKEQNRGTLGLYIDGQPFTGFKYSAEFYYQIGKGETTKAGVTSVYDIAAMMAAVRVGYVIPVFMKPGITAFFDFLSGDDGTDGTVKKTFDTLYATNHKFYGYADLFLNIPVHTKGRGLQDLAVKTQISPTKAVKLGIDFHVFMLAQKRDLASRRLAEEVDLTLVYKYSPDLSFVGGFSYVYAGEGLGAIGKSTKDSRFGYLMSNVTF